MSTWLPDLDNRKGARYVALADEIGKAIRDGRLSAGARLPTQRELARTTGLNLTTVNRGYALATRRGLLSSEVGRGTFVRTVGIPSMIHWPRGADFSGIDLSANLPSASGTVDDIAWAISSFGADSASRLLGYQPAHGLAEHRAAAADWLGQLGMAAPPEQVLTVSGAMHGMSLSLMAICQPGDRVLVEELTSPGIIALCSALGLNVAQVPLDAEGVTPRGLERALDAGAAKALIVVPNLQNPTLSIMPTERRLAIAEVLKRRRVLAVENDVYGPLAFDRPAPLATLAPGLVCYVTSLSKSAAPGMRIGWLVPPPSLLRRTIDRLQATNGYTSPVLMEIAASWIRSGRANDMVRMQREKARQRQALAMRVLQGLSVTTQPTALHIWLELPEPWRAEELVAYAGERDVAVMPSEAFTTSRRQQRAAIRISLCNGSMADLENGLKKLRAILDGHL
ncbi:PLP-dependent aminotransferase family protein [Nitratireductor pacificus]|uniref:GntR family transcriptional regulator n=1 Tax=Nitratireductor pacificus pht-3B TaxID=391937 RepID=K2MKE2_9HYPH|nr:PLP-dependent aminotransferase family protein [Nitratireductor pacificus]EKF17697.1 GntR family transcriptional regulator [Nitratireductor pacificus pht-3B]